MQTIILAYIIIEPKTALTFGGRGCVCSDLSLKIVSRKIPPPLPSGNGYLIYPGEVREEEGDGCLRLSHTVIRHSEPLRLCELFTPSFFCKNYFLQFIERK